MNTIEINVAGFNFNNINAYIEERVESVVREYADTFNTNVENLVEQAISIAKENSYYKLTDTWESYIDYDARTEWINKIKIWNDYSDEGVGGADADLLKHFMEYGTPMHTIVPVNKRRLTVYQQPQRQTFVLRKIVSMSVEAREPYGKAMQFLEDNLPRYIDGINISHFETYQPRNKQGRFTSWKRKK